MSSEWVNRYRAVKSGQPVAPRPPQPSPYGYGQSPPSYAPSPNYPQPVPGAPPHAPYGFDPATGHPIAPCGYAPNGAVIVTAPPPPPQPVAVVQQPQQPYGQPQPGWQPNGLPAPQGYGASPYGYPQGFQGDPNAMPPELLADDTPEGREAKMHWAMTHFRGKGGVEAIGVCERCQGPMIPPTSSREGSVLNTNTGQRVYANARCATCGWDGSFAPGETTMALAGIGAGGSVQLDGPARPAPGARTLDQVAHQHGQPNLFAPRH